MSNEIKVGDKVRVREDAPKILRKIIPLKVFDEYSEVIAQDDEMAVLWTEPIHKNLIPLKYLVKVEEEAKEPKFKVGDRVEELVSRKSGRVLGIEGDFVVVGIPYDKEKYYWHIDSVELVEPTEQTEAEKTKTTHSGNLVFPIAFDLNKALNNCDCFTSVRELIRMKQRDMEENNKPRYVPKIMFNTEFWVKYEADLAKEVALKVANKYNDPKQLADYAVKVAKSVVEGLKRK